MIGSKSSRIPSLDGLRAVSIVLVIVGHLSWNARSQSPLLTAIRRGLWSQSTLGVSIFFVISGFLITSLLVAERESTGKIDIARFYIRRSFRILPAFLVYLGALVIASQLHWLSLNPSDFRSALFFYWNYIPQHHDALLSHTWSLSMEEQFYLLWPLTLAIVGKKRGRIIALALIVLAPILRFGTFHLFPSLQGITGVMLHTRIDALMFGCAIALWKDDGRFWDVIRKAFRFRAHFIAAILLFAGLPFIIPRLPGRIRLPFGYSIEELCISLILVHVVIYPESWAGKFLNWRPVAYLGVLSYILYLWQQPFTFDNSLWIARSFPLNLLAAAFAAQLSYSLIERPFLRLRTGLIRGTMKT